MQSSEGKTNAQVILDRFRKAYRPLTDKEKEHLHNLKLKAEELAQLIEQIPFVENRQHYETLRGCAIAQTKLEECVMWATKALT